MANYSLPPIFSLCCALLVANAPLQALAQESPSFFVEKFDRSVSYRTNVCDRQRQHWNNDIELPDALRGLNLSVVITNYSAAGEDQYFTLVDGKIKESDPGLYAVILDEVASRAGFQWRNSFGVAPPYSAETDGNQTWTDILEWGVHVYDISMEKWGRSLSRLELGISFPTGWWDSSIILAEAVRVNQSKRVVNLWAFLHPFEWTVWMAISVAVLSTGILYWILEYLDVNADERELSAKPLAAIYFASITFTGHFEFKPNTHAARILGFSWTFWAVIVASAYTANLASFLVSPQVEVYRTLTPQDALRKNSSVCVQGGGIIESILKKKFPALWVVPKVTESEIYSSLRLDPGSGGCDTAAHQFNTFQLYEHNVDVNYDCSIQSEKRVVDVLPAGMATIVDTGGQYCTSLISHVLDYHLTQMHSDGFIEEAWRNHVQKVGTIECIKEPPRGGSLEREETFSLKLEEVGGIFILHAILSMTAMALALFQFYYFNTGGTKTLPEVFFVKQAAAEINRRGSSLILGSSTKRDVDDGQEQSGQNSLSMIHELYLEESSTCSEDAANMRKSVPPSDSDPLKELSNH